MRYDGRMPKEVSRDLTVLDPKAKIYISYLAAGFVKIGEDGWPKKVKKKDLAKKLNVDVSMFVYWKKNIPDFWKLVERARVKEWERRQAHVDNAMYLNALKGETAAQKLFYRQNGTLKAEKQDITHHGGLTIDDAMNELEGE